MCKFKECNACKGTGKVVFGFVEPERYTCYQCNGKGTVTADRFRYLTEVYWPKKAAEGAMSQIVLKEKLAELTGWWGGAPAADAQQSTVDILS
jgi:RecJ-like exonuclease